MFNAMVQFDDGYGTDYEISWDSTDQLNGIDF